MDLKEKKNAGFDYTEKKKKKKGNRHEQGQGEGSFITHGGERRKGEISSSTFFLTRGGRGGIKYSCEKRKGG